MIDRRLVTTFVLGFSSGLPLALSSGTLGYWLAASHVDNARIGAFALVEIPYTYKFLLAPVFDHVAAPWVLASLGRRRGWLALTQLGLALAVFATGQTDPVHHPLRTAACAFVIALCSAAQDIVVDATRIESFDSSGQGFGAVANTWGYRVGMLLSGAGALYLSNVMSWPGIYATMAALVGLGFVAVLIMDEPVVRREPSGRTLRDSLREAIVEPLRDFAGRDGALLVLAFLAIFRLGDALAGKMQNPFLVQTGFTAIEIANITKVFGVLATVAGAGLSGWLLARRSARQLLPFAALIMLVSNVVFSWVASVGHDTTALLVAIMVENGTSGIGSTITIVYLSSLCSRDHTATQYALLTSILSFSRTTLAATSGLLANRMEGFNVWLAAATGYHAPNGWFSYFLLTAIAGLPGLFLAWRLVHRRTEAVEA